MTVRLTEIVIDCREPATLATFWGALLGYGVVHQEEDIVEIAGWTPSADAMRAGPVPSTLLFLRVPEGKSVKNRLHLDLSPVDASLDQEVERALGLGARHVDIGQGEQPWVVLADPEGNEFCILRSLQVEVAPS